MAHFKNKAKNSFLNSYDSVDSLDFFYQALSPGLKNNAEVISVLIHRANDYHYFAYQFIRKIIENVKDTEEVASVLYLKDPKQFCSQYYKLFSAEVQKSEALQNTVWNHFLPKWNEAVRSTNSQLQRFKRDDIAWMMDNYSRYSPLFSLIENLSLSKQAILTIIKSYPGNLNVLAENSWLRGVIKDREIALALIDAYQASLFHQTFNYYTLILHHLAKDCDDEKIAELLYKREPTLFHSFSTRLQRDQAFSRKIGRPTYQYQYYDFHKFDWNQYFGHEQKQNNNIIPASVDLGDSKIKELLKMDVWTRASSKEIDNNIKQHAQLILFDQVAKTEREAESMLKKFKEFQNAGCKKFHKNYRKLNQEGHPDKIRQLKDAKMAALIEQGIRNINGAYDTCCKGAQEERANHNPIPKWE